MAKTFLPNFENLHLSYLVFEDHSTAGFYGCTVWKSRWSIIGNANEHRLITAFLKSVTMTSTCPALRNFFFFLSRSKMQKIVLILNDSDFSVAICFFIISLASKAFSLEKPSLWQFLHFFRFFLFNILSFWYFFWVWKNRSNTVFSLTFVTVQTKNF